MMTSQLASLAAKKEKGKPGRASRERGSASRERGLWSPVLVMSVAFAVLLLVGSVNATTFTNSTVSGKDVTLLSHVGGTSDVSLTDISRATSNREISSFTAGTMNNYLIAGATPHTDLYHHSEFPALIFDTSGLPDDAIIDSATVKVYVESKANGLGSPDYALTKIRPATAGTFAAADYSNTDNDTLSDYVTYSSLTGWTTWTLNSIGLSNISVTGYTNVAIRTKWDIALDTTGLTWASDAFTRVDWYPSDSAAPYEPTITIQYHLPNAPTSAFYSDNVATNPYYNVSFYDTSIDVPTSWSWAYKESAGSWTQFSTERYPKFVFPAGTYSINLTATNAYGSDDEVKTNYTVSTDITKTSPRIYPVRSFNSTTSKILPFNYTQTNQAGHTIVFNDTILGAQSTNLSISATRDQFEWSSFVIKPNESISDFDISISDLTDITNVSNTIPSSAIDPYVVKVWYQAAEEDIGYTTINYLLLPELLLKDDSLVLVNYTYQQNLIRLTDSGQTYYFHIDNTTKTTFPSNCTIWDNTTSDGDMQPFVVLKDQNKQIMLTTHIPDGTREGNYTSTINVSSSGTLPINLNFTVRVLPFDLDEPTKFHGIYYMGQVVANYAGIATYTPKTEEQYEADLLNMKNHGISYPMVYQLNNSFIDTALLLRNQSGLPQDKIFWNMGLFSPAPNFNNSALSNIDNVVWSVKYVQNISTFYGFNETYIYSIDEPAIIQMQNELPVLQAVQNNGSKTMTATYPVLRNLYAGVGSAMDFAVLAQTYNSTARDEWHSIGKKVGLYAYPQGGAEIPEVYRNHFGLGLWNAGYDSGFDFAYQAQYPTDTGSMWNDFDGTGSSENRDHNMVYSKTNGAINTMQFEGYREGVDDTRFADKLSYITGSTTFATEIITSGIANGQDMATIRETLINNITSHDYTPEAYVKNRGTVRIPALLTFTDTSTNSPTSWNYSFGDGTYSSLQNPVKRYTKPGRYNVSLTVSNTWGSGTTYTTVIVQGGSPQQGIFDGNPLMVNYDDGTYTSSRELTDAESVITIDNMDKTVVQ